ncbi:aminoglycoside phosphotransferase family protein [Vibrio vulnificus]|uniref:aminoglycoside phosphotransferase family protein n=1 Tax=Vibrio vulnificus TaxID=672 RepID=UPI0025551785|nr:aminoglycoside phosphotransferase family protein [Vibrio vulnificus]WIL74412.1 aminoglycoside phosphotransferase family protein [Vibrio vulnificus]
MKFSKVLYKSAFSHVSVSDCGSFVLKSSKRSLANEIKVLSKLEACPNTPNLIEVVDDKSIILERLEVCDAHASEMLFALQESVIDFAKQNEITLDLPLLGQRYIETTLKERIDEIYSHGRHMLPDEIGELKRIFEDLRPRLLGRPFFVASVLNHGDLHAGNVMSRSGKFVLIDWEDAMLVPKGMNGDLELSVMYQVQGISLFLVDFLRYGSFTSLRRQRDKIGSWLSYIKREHSSLLIQT